ncbi:hypothetical protein GE115_02370 [Agromyces sp. CFH 90414]|uniref:Transglutaminase-like domain-containing protein n=1 Tax=Agromyces agglutinans TaxID=2662258 RepID=A0A6I2F2I5_9MICO|nr:DUF3488 and transglutaminase-like domain-containing protein [Agromyces agglutinans]MRG58722.1 hypothetical protein [Agromyces agglutinans]
MRADPTLATGQRAMPTVQRAMLAGATFLLVMVTTSALGTLIEGSGWWWLCAFIAACLVSVGLGLRALRTPPALVPLLQVGALILLLTLVFGGRSSFALIVPTGETFARFAELFAGAERTIQQQSVPAISVPPLLFALAVGVGAIVIVADALVQDARRPALAAIPVLVPIFIPGFLIEDGAEVIVLLFAGAAFLLLLRLDVRVRRRADLAHRDDDEDAPVVHAPRRVPIGSTIGATLGVGVAGLVAAAVLTASTPSISQSLLLGSDQSTTLFSRGVSPFIDLGRDLRRPDAVPAFTYTARDGDRPYFTLLTLDRFEGEVWGVTDRAVDSENTVDRMPRPIGLDPAVETAEHPVEVTVGDLRTVWLPVPYPTASVEDLRGSWFWDRESLTVRSVDASTAGQRYVANRLVATPTADQLRDADLLGSGQFQEYRALPDERPQIIRDTALAIAGGAQTPYDAAVAIQDHLRSSDFSYSVDAPVEEGYDGGGFDVIANFLEVKSGYCVHFASTMAVLAREVGIPSRISIGYTAGSPTDERVENVTVVEVDSHDLHAWPELFFPGVGWVPFEPTPGRGTVPSYTRPDAAQSPLSPFGPSTSTPQTGRPDLDPERGLSAGPGASAPDPVAAWTRVAALVIAALAIALAPALIRIGQRWSRRRRVRHGPGRAQAAWDEVRATARDLSAGGLETETPRAFAAHIAERPAFDGDAGAFLAELRNAVERERYGPPAPSGAAAGGEAGLSTDEILRAMHEVRAALGADAGASARLRARFLPASLIGRARGRARPTPAGA